MEMFYAKVIADKLLSNNVFFYAPIFAEAIL